jgi:hypothetical protein
MRHGLHGVRPGPGPGPTISRAREAARAQMRPPQPYSTPLLPMMAGQAARSPTHHSVPRPFVQVFVDQRHESLDFIASQQQAF